MKRHYDIVFLTNTPSFYKLNLCREIAKHKSLLLVLYGYGAEAVNMRMEDGDFPFDFEFINEGDANDRSKVRTFCRLIKLMQGVDAERVLYSGWLAPEYNLYSFLSPRHRNVVLCESSIWDVDFAGVKGFFKKSIINRMNYALPSGKPHDQLFEKIGFSGKRYVTGSVGIINKSVRTPHQTNNPLKFLYVGRLVDVKNLSLLVDAFNANGKPLTIVGSGPLETELKARANDNISFVGFVENERLGDVYRAHDVFILPSYSETWGLVVEEAVYWGLPVIVSDRVGSGPDMVSDLHTGEIFKSGSVEDLQAKIEKIESNYPKYLSEVEKVDFEARHKAQVGAYLKLFD